LALTITALDEFASMPPDLAGAMEAVCGEKKDAPNGLKSSSKSGPSTPSAITTRRLPLVEANVTCAPRWLTV
jgi:hypothetical protein